MDLDGEILARVEEFDQDRELAVRADRLNVAEQVAVEFRDVGLERAAGERAAGDFAAGAVAAVVALAGRKIVNLPALADLLAGRERFAEDRLDLSPAPDFLDEARLEFQR